MRVFAAALVALLMLACGREGLPEADEEQDMVPSIFNRDSKLQGQAELINGANEPTELISVRTVDNSPRVMTVTLATPNARQSNLLVFPIPQMEVVAIIKLGVGGVSYDFEVDYQQGVQFPVCANALAVWAQYRLLAGSSAHVPPLRVAASVGEDSIGNGVAPQRTVSSVTTLAAGATQQVPQIPMFSKSFQVLGYPSTGDLRLSAYNAAGLTMSQYIVTSLPSGELPLPNDAIGIAVANVGGAVVDHWRLVFKLAL